MFIFRAVLGVKWFLLEQNRSNDRRVTRADVEALFAPAKAPDVSFFTRYLGGFIVGILTLGIVASLLKGAGNSVGSILVFLVGLAFVALFVVLSWRSHQAAKTQPQAVQPVQPVQPSVC